jgi:hypothetical protein
MDLVLQFTYIWHTTLIIFAFFFCEDWLCGIRPAHSSCYNYKRLSYQVFENVSVEIMNRKRKCLYTIVNSNTRIKMLGAAIFCGSINMFFFHVVVYFY